MMDGLFTSFSLPHTHLAKTYPRLDLQSSKISHISHDFIIFTGMLNRNVRIIHQKGSLCAITQTTSRRLGRVEIRRTVRTDKPVLLYH
jgi:hypothetical protein